MFRSRLDLGLVERLPVVVEDGKQLPDVVDAAATVLPQVENHTLAVLVTVEEIR